VDDSLRLPYPDIRTGLSGVISILAVPARRTLSLCSDRADRLPKRGRRRATAVKRILRNDRMCSSRSCRSLSQEVVDAYSDSEVVPWPILPSAADAHNQRTFELRERDRGPRVLGVRPLVFPRVVHVHVRVGETYRGTCTAEIHGDSGESLGR